MGHREDNGTYTITLQDHAVSDTLGNFNTLSSLGTFDVDLNFAPAFSFDFNDFSDASSLLFNGVAAANNGILRLTPAATWQAGSVFYHEALDIDSDTSFKTEFQFQISGGDGSKGSDGFTFMLQSKGSNALGSRGSGLGYAGVSQSVAIEFDTYKWQDPNNNHVAVLANGDQINHLVFGTPTFNLNGGDVLNAWIEYDGLTDELEVFVSDGISQPEDSLFSYTIDLTSVLGSTAYVGFSAGTGGLANNHDILNWEFN